MYIDCRLAGTGLAEAHGALRISSAERHIGAGPPPAFRLPIERST